MRTLLGSLALFSTALASPAFAQTVTPAAVPAATPPATPAATPAAGTLAVPARMQWFADAKLGIFIHWGIYAVSDTSESWSFFNGETTFDQYMAQRKGFTASRYDPAAWAKLIKDSGARYAVLTSRHHDGIALWNSAKGKNVVRDTPAKRDLIAPYAKALREQDLKVGLYYSLPNWSYADYDVMTRDKKRYDIKADPARWDRYRGYMNAELADIARRYNPDLYWFDGDWEHSAAEWQAPDIRKRLLAHNPNAIMNSRIAGSGDYETPEQGVPVVKPAAPFWELCMTMNMSWGTGRPTTITRRRGS